MSRRFIASALVTLAFGCKSEVEPPSRIGVELRVTYDSSLDVDSFALFAVDGAQNVILERTMFDAPLFLEPPGLRVATLSVELANGEAGMDLDLWIDGVSEDGVVGSGRTMVTLEAAKLVEASVRLGAPTDCGDGRVHPSLEQCDDGGAAVGDGCDDRCIVEPGYICRGTPSVCVRCGNGIVETGETCDDGNLLDGDGCNRQCGSEPDVFKNVIEVERLATFTTSVADWVPVTDAELVVPPSDADDAWLVFVTGTMGTPSDAEADAVIAVFLDDVERDRFGHQTLGEGENDAGFVSFFVARGEAEHRVHVELRSASGAAYVRSLRLVAARIPASADLQYVDSDEGGERRGIDEQIERLDISPSSPGEYIFLAKASVSEEPGDDTARTWVVGADGRRYPDAPEGIGFTNGRAPLAPMFVAFNDRIDGDATVRLEGTSSGAGEVGDWYDNAYPYRRPLTIGGANLPGGVSVQFTYDHASDVAAGRSRADGQDVRVVWSDGQRAFELDRVVDPQSSWDASDTQLWVRLPNAVARGGTLHLYFGAANPGAAPADPDQVFDYFHRFTNLDGWNFLRGNPTVNMSGRLQVTSGVAGLSVAQYDVTQPKLFEARLRFTVDPAAGPSSYWGLASAAAVGGTDGGRLAWFDVDPNAGHVVHEGAQLGGWKPDTLDSYHVYGVTYGPAQSSVRFTQDDFEIARYASTFAAPDTSVQMFFDNAAEDGSTILIDWVRVRRFVEPEIDIQVGPVEGSVGIEASTWRYRRIVAFRADAFDLVQSSAYPELVTTTSTFTEVVHELSTEAPSATSEYLVIQNARIAGESSLTGAKSGVLLADGTELLRTQHRISRDDSFDSGYHHVAGVVHRRVSDRPVTYTNGVASPDGIRTTIAGSSILVLRYAPR